MKLGNIQKPSVCAGKEKWKNLIVQILQKTGKLYTRDKEQRPRQEGKNELTVGIEGELKLRNQQKEDNKEETLLKLIRIEELKQGEITLKGLKKKWEEQEEAWGGKIGFRTESSQTVGKGKTRRKN